MSVFQAQEWWSVKMSEDEEFDLGSMIIGNIDNAVPSVNKIAVGSQQGVFRMYQPSKAQFKVEDLVLEESLGSPILQLLLGHYIPGSNELGVAVLHPRSLVIYEIVPQGQRDGRVSFYAMKKSYQLPLGQDGKHFTAYNMTSGSFGGVKGKEMLIVQSMDGKIQIFEQSANAFTRQLVDCLIPGPISYLPKIDAFLTVNHACQADCYRYQILVNTQVDIGSSQPTKASNGLTTVRSAMTEWSFNLGENCRQVLPGNFTTASSNSSNGSGSMAGESKGRTPERNSRQGQSPSNGNELLMICSGSLFLIKTESGSLVQQRRLERGDAVCACAYPSDVPSQSNFILATDDNMLQVYNNFSLVWAAKVLDLPVQIAVSSFGSPDMPGGVQKGLIVTLSDNGVLSIQYLGTKPPVSAVMSQVRELNYEKIDLEHKALLQVIRESQYENKADTSGRIVIRSQMPKTLDLDPPQHGDTTLPLHVVPLEGIGMGEGMTYAKDGAYVRISVRLYLTFTGDTPAQQVSVIVSTPSSIHAIPKNILLQKVGGLKTTPIMIQVHLYALSSALPTSLDASVAAHYLTAKGEPRVSSHTLQLPLYLLCRPKAPAKTAPCKVILDTADHAAVPLTYLFDDLLYAAQQAGSDVNETLGRNAGQAIGFQLFVPSSSPPPSSGSPSTPSPTPSPISPTPFLVSVLASKTAGRYRVQADSYPALYLITSELERRLRLKLGEDRQGKKEKDKDKDKDGDAHTIGIVTCNDTLPIEDYFAAINSHYHSRQQIVGLNSILNDVAHQYRTVLKRLLVRYKDKNPTSLHGLEVIMKETYASLLLTADQLEECQKRLHREQDYLHGFSRLMASLCAIKYSMTPSEASLWQSFLCPDIQDGLQQGWEETVDAALTYLLKTSLATTAKETTSSLSGVNLELPSSIQTLKKHFLLAVDRLEKGARLIPSSTYAPTGSPKK